MHNVRVEATALGRSSGSGALHQVSSNDGQATLRLGERESAIGTTVRVSIRRLDDLLDSLGVAEVDVMKIDVEGAEHEVLVGFERFLAERPPRVIFVECIGRHLRRFDSSALELVDLLVSYDYDVFRMSKGKWHRLGPGVRLGDDFAADIMAVHRTAASAAA